MTLTVMFPVLIEDGKGLLTLTVVLRFIVRLAHNLKTSRSPNFSCYLLRMLIVHPTAYYKKINLKSPDTGPYHTYCYLLIINRFRMVPFYAQNQH